MSAAFVTDFSANATVMNDDTGKIGLQGYLRVGSSDGSNNCSDVIAQRSNT